MMYVPVCVIAVGSEGTLLVVLVVTQVTVV